MILQLGFYDMLNIKMHAADEIGSVIRSRFFEAKI